MKLTIQIVKLGVFLLLATVAKSNFAQQIDDEKKLVLTIGDTIIFSNVCDSGYYNKIDVYTKTRYLETKLDYDTLTGDGFYQAFFTEGDFDGKRLPCSYANKKFVITSTQSFTDNNTGEDRFVVFILLEEWNKVAWIEFIDAYEAGEINL